MSSSPDPAPMPTQPCAHDGSPSPGLQPAKIFVLAVVLVTLWLRRNSVAAGVGRWLPPLGRGRTRSLRRDVERAEWKGPDERELSGSESEPGVRIMGIGRGTGMVKDGKVEAGVVMFPVSVGGFGLEVEVEMEGEGGEQEKEVVKAREEGGKTEGVEEDEKEVDGFERDWSGC